MATRLDLRCDYDRRVSFALQQNDVPVIRLLRVDNGAEVRVSDVAIRVSSDPAVFDPWETHIGAIDAGSSYNLRDLPLVLSAERLAVQVEREAGHIHLEARVDGEIASSVVLDFEILPFNHWSGVESLPELLAAFILPNQPAVMAVLKKARPELERLTGDTAFNGYQARSRQRVVAMSGAIYAAIQGIGITYVNPPASFERAGQKVRLPEQVVGAQMGTCLDLTVLIAAALEQAGLNPFVCIVDGHAFPGVWLDEFVLPEPAIADPAAIRKRVDGEAALVFDSSAVAQKVDFRHAVEVGRRYLEDNDGFVCAVDVTACRVARIHPLPVRQTSTGWEAAQTDSAPPARQPASMSAAIPQLRLRADTAPAVETTRTRLDRWKGKLLDLSLRNRLLNVRFTLKSVIPFAGADVGELEDLLAGGKTLALLPKPEEREVFGPRSTQLMEQRVNADVGREFFRDALDRGRIHADLPQAELLSRLTKLYRDSRTALQESGSNTLYLALGFLSYYEADNATTERLAPIVLLPVELERGSPREPFRVRATDDDPRINVTLLKKLATEFGVNVKGLDQLPEDDSGLDLALILDRFRQAVMEIPRWDVVSRAAIGEFSFAKYLMWADLEDRTETLLDNPLFKHIMEGDGAEYPLARGFITSEAIDAARPASDDLCVVDADSSQLTAIYGARDGNSFVLQGPPGTGKSQTITNLIAQLVSDGKTVLFVSEKMAALEVVHKRLKDAGLGEFCLELHSNKVNKAGVTRQLAAPFELVARREPTGWAARAAELQALRVLLNEFVEALHEPGPYGESVFQAGTKLLAHADAPVVRLAIDGDPSRVTRERVDAIRRSLDAVEVAARDVPDPSAHAWQATPARDWSPRLERAVSDTIDRTLERVDALQTTASAAAEALGLTLPAFSDSAISRLDRAAELLMTSPRPPRGLMNAETAARAQRHLGALETAARERQTSWAEVEHYFDPALLQLDLAPLAARFGRWGAAFFVIAFFMLWSSRRALKRFAPGGRVPPNQVVAEALEHARAVQSRDEVLQRAHGVQDALGSMWDGIDTDWGRVNAMLGWTERCRSLILELGDEMAGGALLPDAAATERFLLLATEQHELLGPDRPRGRALSAFRASWKTFREERRELCRLLGWPSDAAVPSRVAELGAAREQLRAWREGLRSLREWCAWTDAVLAAHLEAIAVPLIRAHTAGDVPGASLRPAFERALATWWFEEGVSTEAALKEFRGTTHDARIARFQALDREMRLIAREEIRSRLASRVPSLSGAGEMALLRKELKKQRRHMPIRSLFSRIPHTLMKLKPCVLMSPLSVAQYLDPNLSLFDIVVFDEASQIPPWDAIGAIARGRQMVVVGDSKQLPPTNFFQKEEEVPDDDDMEELESILDECIRAGFAAQSLRWHYRSRHEALIAFSNHHYYDNRLHTFPAADQAVPSLGVKWRHVANGFYDKGRSRTNQAEAQAVVAEIVRRLTDPALSEKSIGVVTFSQAQQSLILDLLDDLRREHDEIERFFTEAVHEPVFVKNLENVQGDERDVILFSICYAPDRAGKLAMNFGPLNRQGGERRLNVAVTRARELLLVFSTLRPDQIDLARTQAVGVAHLKTFLDYAMRGPRAIDEAVALDPAADFESPFEEAVCDRLRAEGWSVDLQVGCAGYRIDLAVRHPERPGSYLLGIECDGATYHSARAARDRDRIRQAVLESLGWRLFRIWSLDWWHDKERVMANLRAAILDARAASRTGLAPPAGVNGSAHTPAPIETAAPRKVDIQELLRAEESGPGLPEIASYFPAVATPQLGTREAWDDPRTLPEIARRLQEVVAEGGPIHVAEAARRVGASWDTARASKGNVTKLIRALPHVHAERRPTLRGEFLWPAGVDADTWHGFRVPADEATRVASEHLVPEEVANAAAWIISCSGSVGVDELATELARLFGFRSTGKNVRVGMESGVDYLISTGRAKLDHGAVVLTRA